MTVDALIHDVAIVGAGIAGASLAWSLGQRSGAACSVALVEMEAQPGYHTTGRSAAIWVESYGGPGIVPLSRASRSFFVDPPAGFTPGPLLSPRPGLNIAPPDDQGELEALAAEFDIGGVDYRRLDAVALAGYAILKPEWRTRALLEEDCYDIDVAALHQGYLRGVAGWKPTLHTDAEVSACVRQDGVWTLTTRAGPIRARTLVNAAGAWADPFAALAGAQPRGLQPLRRTMAVLIIDPPPPADLPTIFDAKGRFYFKSDGSRLWLSPHDETPDVAHDVRPDEMDLAIVIDQFEQASTARVVRLDSSWAGLRTFTADRLPVFGWDGAVEGLFWCAGQGGFGIQTAPAAADLCAALLLGETPKVDATPYLATREYR